MLRASDEVRSVPFVPRYSLRTGSVRLNRLQRATSVFEVEREYRERDKSMGLFRRAYARRRNVSVPCARRSLRVGSHRLWWW